MAKISVTYHAPKDDEKTVEMGGIKFTDGEAVDIEEGKADANMIAKLKGNPNFKVSGGDDPHAKAEPKKNQQHG